MRSWRYISSRIKLFIIFLVSLCIIQLFIIFISAAVIHELYKAFLLIGVLLILILVVFYQFVYKPYKNSSHLLKLFAQGYTMERVYDVSPPISPEIKAAFERFRELINTTELINLSVKQSQYLALQNQINPHFLYNTLEAIRGEALCVGVTSIAQMTEALSTFFRYTISNMDSLVTLEEELENIENYYIIQQYRFGDRLSLSVEIDDEDSDWILNCRMPKLTLQPIVENSIYHGLEPKLGKGNLKIKIESTKNLLIITVSDDGLGFEEERLSILNNALNGISMDYVKPDREKKGGIALINVNSRIKLLFGEKYGLYIYSTPGAGTDVQITLPVIKDAKIPS